MNSQDASKVAAGAIVAMQLRPDMPTVHCRIETHGPMTQLHTPLTGGLEFKCASCGSSAPVTDEQIRLALGAAALPIPEPHLAGSPLTETGPFPSGSVALAQTEHRIEVRSGTSVSLSTAVGVVAAIVATGLAAQVITGLLVLVVGAAVGIALAVVLRRRHAHHNRGRAPWLPGERLHVIDLQTGTWIATPLTLDCDQAPVTPHHAARVHSVTGIPDSPQTGYVALTLSDGHSYTAPGRAPVLTLHVEAVPS